MKNISKYLWVLPALVVFGVIAWESPMGIRARLRYLNSKAANIRADGVDKSERAEMVEIRAKMRALREKAEKKWR